MCNSTKFVQPPRSKVSRFWYSEGMWSSTKSEQFERSNFSRLGVITRLRLLTIEEHRLMNFSFGHSTGMWSSTKSSQFSRCNVSRFGVIPRSKLIKSEQLRSRNLSLLRTYHKEKRGLT
ncbi:hypothetical protein HanIR_Chr09g0392521 [Helianthus annuus]|nr:hypothetical protein HanIR_Chr09g0392521 [Helianthus annuus]